MGMELKLGLTGLSMTETGSMGKLMERVHSHMSTETAIRVIGCTTKLMELEGISIRTGLPTKVNGKMIFKMEKALNDGLMVLSMKAFTQKARNTDLETTNGTTDQNTSANGMTIKSQA